MNNIANQSEKLSVNVPPVLVRKILFSKEFLVFITIIVLATLFVSVAISVDITMMLS